MKSYRPPLSDVPPHLKFAVWAEPLEERPNGDLLFEQRVHEVVQWARGGCGAHGRMWKGEPPEKCPTCGAGWETT